MQKQGYTSQVLGMHLKDALDKIERESETDMPHDSAINDFQQADLPLSNGMTLRTGLRFLKQILHHPDIQISGDTIVDGENLELRVRVVDAKGKAYMRTAIGLDSQKRKALAYLGLSYVHILRREYAQAEQEANLAIRHEPDNAYAYNSLGVAISEGGKSKDKGKIETAIEKFQKSLNLNPNNANAYSNWGGGLINLG